MPSETPTPYHSDHRLTGPFTIESAGKKSEAVGAAPKERQGEPGRLHGACAPKRALRTSSGP